MGRKNNYESETKKIVTVSNYSAIAEIYPHIMRSIDYDKWADYVYQISKEVKKKNISVLELACGTDQARALREAATADDLVRLLQPEREPR